MYALIESRAHGGIKIVLLLYDALNSLGDARLIVYGMVRVKICAGFKRYDHTERRRREEMVGNVIM